MLYYIRKRGYSKLFALALRTRSSKGNHILSEILTETLGNNNPKRLAFWKRTLDKVACDGLLFSTFVPLGGLRDKRQPPPKARKMEGKSIAMDTS